MSLDVQQIKPARREVITDRWFVESSKVRELGSVAGRLYVEFDGKEWAIGSPTIDVERAGTFVAYPRLVTDEGTGRQHARGSDFRRATEVDAGTYEALVAAPGKRVKVEPMLPVRARADGLLSRHPSVLGPAAMIALYARHDIAIDDIPGTDYVNVQGKGRRLMNPDRDDIERRRPLIAGFVKDRPLMCVGTHAKPEPAVELLVGGAPICEKHLMGGLS